jgi:protein involved in polysaccharide export with SLBB domain
MNNFFSFLILTLLLIGSSHVSSQEDNFDDDFLNGLPDSVREDILEERDSNEIKDQKTLSKRPSSSLSKLETVKRWEDLQKKTAYAENKSDRYGLNLFLTMQSTFMPINEPNFDPTYILDFGDSISINIIGNSQVKLKDETYNIDRDGSIYLPEIGKLFLSGLNLDSASRIIIDKISKLYVGAEAIISLESIRDIKILIAGHAQYPGLYTFNGNTDIFHAIAMAGGILESGSMRAVELKREGKIVQTYDLYNTLILGDTSTITTLRSGDVIFIKPVKNIASTGQGFNIQASFELRDDETLQDLYLFAGGATKFVNDNKFNLIRLDGESFSINEFKIEKLSDIKIKNSDKLSLNTNTIHKVEILGEVASPGFYSISDGDTLSKLVERAGGYKQNAYAFGAFLFRQKAKDLELMAAKKAYRELISYVAARPEDMPEAEGLSFILSELSSVNPQGRVNVEFDLTKIANNPLEDTLLSNKDKIVIPRYDEAVYVFGEVLRPGAVRFDNKFSLNSYLDGSGGMTKYADTRYLLVIDPDGKAHNIKRTLGFLNQRNLDIYPGSTIYIPRNIGKLNGIDFVSVTSPIFSSLALTLASINSLDD